jgi:RHS repeat-associated protein
MFGRDAVLSANGSITSGSALPASTFEYTDTYLGFAVFNQWTGEYADAQGWGAPQHYKTFSTPDVNGDGKNDICARASAGIVCSLSTGSSFSAMTLWSSAYSDADGWAGSPSHYETIEFIDLNGDGKDDICGRAPSGLYCGLSTGSGFSSPTLWTGYFANQSSCGTTTTISTLVNQDGFASNDGEAGTWTVVANCRYSTKPIDDELPAEGVIETVGLISFATDTLPDDAIISYAEMKGCMSFKQGEQTASLHKTSFNLPITSAAYYSPSQYLMQLPDTLGAQTVQIPASAIDVTKRTQFLIDYPNVCSAQLPWAGRQYASTSSGSDPCSAAPWTLTLTYNRGCPVTAASGWQTEEHYWGSITYTDVNGDGKTDVCGKAPDGIYCGLSNGNFFTTPTRWSTEFASAGWISHPSYWKTIQYPDVNADGKADICGRGSDGIRCAISDGTQFSASTLWSSAYSDAAAWKVSDSYYSTIRFPDVNGDGSADVCGRSSEGLACAVSTGRNFANYSLWGTTYNDANGWTLRNLYSTFTYLDVNSDGRTDVCARAAGGVICSLSQGWTFTGASTWALGFTDAFGWGSSESYYSTIKFADLNGDGMSDVLGRSSTGILAQISNSRGRGDLLKQQRSALGGITDITYAPTAQFVNTNNPPNLPVVSSLAVSDGRTPIRSTTFFSYSGGFYDRALRKNFGFRMTMTQSPCLVGESQCPVTETYFLQNHRATIGFVDRSLKRVGFGNYLSQVSHHYSIAGNGTTTSYKPLLTRVDRAEYDGTGPACTNWPCFTGRRGSSTYEYDAYGNNTLVFDSGNQDVAGDELSVRTHYVPNASLYIVSKAAWTRVLDGATRLKETQLLYDGASSVGEAPSVGLVTEHREWLDLPTSTWVNQRMRYDSVGNLTRTIDALSNVTLMEYDSAHNSFPVRVTNPQGHVNSQNWDAGCGAIVSATDENGQRFTHTYDALCQLQMIAGPLGSFIQFAYMNQGDPNTQHVVTYTPPSVLGTPVSDWSREFTDGLGRVYKSEASAPGGRPITILQEFDARGNIQRASRPFYSGEAPLWTQTQYDVTDRPIRVVAPNGAQTTYSYTHKLALVTDPMGHRTRIETDFAGRLVNSSEYFGGDWRAKLHRYDRLGRLIEMSDPLGNLTSYKYDSLDRLIEERTPNRGVSRSTYDLLGRQVETQDSMGRVTLMTYDPISRLQTKTVQAGTANARTTTLTYDENRPGYFNLGRLTRIADPSSSSSDTIDYDALGRKVRRVMILGTNSYSQNYGYDAGGRLRWKSFPDGTSLGSASAPLLYDEAGRLVRTRFVFPTGTVSDLTTSVLWNADGTLKSLVNANGTRTDLTYEDGGGIRSIVTARAGTTLQNINYTRNLDGMITRIESPNADENWEYSYDEAHQLTNANAFSMTINSVSVNPDYLGNILSHSRYGAYTYPASGPESTRPNAVSTAGTARFAYDSLGQMTSNAGSAMIWNNDSLLAQYRNGTYVYSLATQARLQKTEGSRVTTYLPGFADDYEIVGTTHTKYVSIGGLLTAKVSGTSPSKRFWIHADHLGSVNQITNTTGTQVLRRSYRPYGEQQTVVGSHSEPRGFTGQTHDRNGLIYLNARYLDPKLGRFVSTDPLSGAPGLIGLNEYAYANNNPINFRDITGGTTQTSEGCRANNTCLEATPTPPAYNLGWREDLTVTASGGYSTTGPYAPGPWGNNYSGFASNEMGQNPFAGLRQTGPTGHAGGANHSGSSPSPFVQLAQQVVANVSGGMDPSSGNAGDAMVTNLVAALGIANVTNAVEGAAVGAATGMAVAIGSRALNFVMRNRTELISIAKEIKAVRGTSLDTRSAFRTATPKEISDTFIDRGFSVQGRDPLRGKGTYFNESTTIGGAPVRRGYQIDPGGYYGKKFEPRHIDVWYRPGMGPNGADKRKIFYDHVAPPRVRPNRKGK